MAKRSRDKAPRKTTRTPRKAAPKVTEVKEMEDVGGGMTLDDGIVISTSVALVFAVVLVYLANGVYA